MLPLVNFTRNFIMCHKLQRLTGRSVYRYSEGWVALCGPSRPKFILLHKLFAHQPPHAVPSTQRLSHTKSTAQQRLALVGKDQSQLTLPSTCPGCGAYSQIVNPNDAGFYSSRKSVKEYLDSQQKPVSDKSSQEALTYQNAVKDLDAGLLESFGIDADTSTEDL